MALSNRWLLVPIAEAAVSAAVESDRHGSRITCRGKVQRSPLRLGHGQTSLAAGATTCMSPVSARGLSEGLLELEDGLL